MSIPYLSPKIVLLLFLAVAGEAAWAAESYDGCTGYIDSVPAVISSQGTWCLRENLGTAINNGSAITVTANNATLDCNDFKIGGLAAGTTSQAYGIRADNGVNVTVRNCVVRGFHIGIYLLSGSGNVVEDNLVDQSLYRGIFTNGVDSVVRDNRVNDTGGAPGITVAYAIAASGGIVGNTVSGVFADATNSYPYGIYAYGAGTVVRGNRISSLASGGNGYARGIVVTGPGTRVADNWIAISTSGSDHGVDSYSSGTFCTNNTVSSAAQAYIGCDASHGNLP